MAALVIPAARKSSQYPSPRRDEQRQKTAPCINRQRETGILLLRQCRVVELNKCRDRIAEKQGIELASSTHTTTKNGKEFSSKFTLDLIIVGQHFRDSQVHQGVVIPLSRAENIGSNCSVRVSCLRDSFPLSLVVLAVPLLRREMGVHRRWFTDIFVPSRVRDVRR